jgi:alpha-D-ribose 1-methylphosphonate 5-triphosphate synthase subunit PhnH
MLATGLAPGFDDAVTDAQQVFHAAMMALASPGEVQNLAKIITAPPQPLSGAAAALTLALADYETPIWLDEKLRANESVAQYLRFHTGARIVDHADQAAFAIISDPASPDISFAEFAQGLPEYPDRSTTLILQLDAIESDSGFVLSGPGILQRRKVSFSPLPSDFLEQWQANYALFPCGIDIFGVAGAQLFGLPRSTKLEA